MQQIPSGGQPDSIIQFRQERTDDEGNLFAIIRLLAKSNPSLKARLEHGPQNTLFTSKTIQNEVIGVTANLTRDHFCQCLEKCEICVPSKDERFECLGEESWDWDASTRTLANGLTHTMRSFGHIFCFVCTMDMLEPMRPLASALQGRLVEVYFGFKKVE